VKTKNGLGDKQIWSLGPGPAPLSPAMIGIWSNQEGTCLVSCEATTCLSYRN